MGVEPLPFEEPDPDPAPPAHLEYDPDPAPPAFLDYDPDHVAPAPLESYSDLAPRDSVPSPSQSPGFSLSGLLKLVSLPQLGALPEVGELICMESVMPETPSLSPLPGPRADETLRTIERLAAVAQQKGLAYDLSAFVSSGNVQFQHSVPPESMTPTVRGINIILCCHFW